MFPVGDLLAWFRANARDLPWRRTTDPYAIWVSEIMLQQTQVKTVIPYWERWMRELPNTQSLADAPEQKLLKLWEGLGYYTRVRNLQKGARQIIERHSGIFPTAHDDILALSGIGRYTAGAIGSIAFNQPVPLLDGNVIRVFTRFYGISENAKEKETTNRLWQIAEELVTQASKQPNASLSLSSGAEERARERRPTTKTSNRTSKNTDALNLLLTSEGRRIEDEGCLSDTSIRGGNCSHFNQALMELGATVCTPATPACLLCPLQKNCLAYRDSRQAELPNLGERTAATQRRFFAYVIQRENQVLVHQRPAGVVNAGLWEFPNLEVALKEKDPLEVTRSHWSKAFTTVEPLCAIKHSITRYRITLEAFRASLKPRTELPAELGEWYPLEKLHDLPFTSAHGKIRKKLLS